MQTPRAPQRGFTHREAGATENYELVDSPATDRGKMLASIEFLARYATPQLAERQEYARARQAADADCCADGAEAPQSGSVARRAADALDRVGLRRASGCDHA